MFIADSLVFLMYASALRSCILSCFIAHMLSLDMAWCSFVRVSILLMVSSHPSCRHHLAATTQADAPDLLKIPEEDRIGVTAVIVTCSYREKEFMRVGYYVNNELNEPVPEGVEAPVPTLPSQLRRNVLVDQPRVTRFPIDWS